MPQLPPAAARKKSTPSGVRSMLPPWIDFRLSLVITKKAKMFMVTKMTSEICSRGISFENYSEIYFIVNGWLN